MLTEAMTFLETQFVSAILHTKPKPQRKDTHSNWHLDAYHKKFEKITLDWKFSRGCLSKEAHQFQKLTSLCIPSHQYDRPEWWNLSQTSCFDCQLPLPWMDKLQPQVVFQLLANGGSTRGQLLEQLCTMLGCHHHDQKVPACGHPELAWLCSCDNDITKRSMKKRETEHWLN